MAIFPIQNIATALENWAQARFMPTVQDVQWGWQIWLQTDFVAWINAQAPAATPYDFQREVTINANNVNYRVDWAVNLQESQNVNDYAAIEIIAQRPLADLNTMIGEFDTAVQRLTAIKNAYPAMTTAVLSGVLDQDFFDWLTDIQNAHQGVPLVEDLNMALVWSAI